MVPEGHAPELRSLFCMSPCSCHFGNKKHGHDLQRLSLLESMCM